MDIGLYARRRRLCGRFFVKVGSMQAWNVVKLKQRGGAPWGVAGVVQSIEAPDEAQAAPQAAKSKRARGRG